jgi:hypothetical protein
MAEIEPPIVWCRMTDQGRESLEAILARKEAERLSGSVFWWGMGTALKGVPEIAASSRALLSVQFSAAFKKDAPSPHCLWTQWETAEGLRRDIPPHALVVGPRRKTARKYALICASDEPVTLDDQPFNVADYQNFQSGKRVGDSQSAAILTRRRDNPAVRGAQYEVGFRARLVEPWQVKLVHPPRILTEVEWNRLCQWRPGEDWLDLAHSIRG